MATFRKRGDKWEAQVRRKGHSTATKSFLYRQDAEAWARRVESEMERGIYIARSTAESTTLKEALDRYDKEISSHKRGSDKESYVLRRFAESKLAPLTMASIRSADVAAWRDQRLKTVSPSTVRRELVVLGHVFTIARKEWDMEGLINPVEGTSKPKASRGRTRRISDSELDAIIDATNSVELPAVIHLAVETSMRRGEIVGLEWENIDLERRVAHLPETKNGDPRDIPLSRKAVATLASLLPESTGRHDKPMGRVFTSKPDTITQAFIRAVKRARETYEAECKKARKKPDPDYLTDVRLHDGRHEGTSRFFEKGLDVMEAATITGHKDLRMLKRYTHLRAEDLAKKLD